VVPTLHAQSIGVWFAGGVNPGAEDYMAACAEAAASFGDNVRFLGYVPDIAALIARSSAVAVPSHHEGLVRSMIEAMSCGRPVVSFDVCSARELLDDESGGAGVVVRSGDYPAMTDALVRYCTDPRLAKAAGQRGRAAALRLFDRDAVVERYESVYDMLQRRHEQV
jgi:glycosyltransferase involved in cell wall biosynthesis